MTSNKISIGIVEDIEAARRNLEEMLSRNSDFLLSGSFETAEEALVFFYSHPCDVVIMDINLPGMSGIECVRKIKLHSPKTQIMMFTIFEDSDRIVEALKAGASGYLIKKNSPSKIPDAIRELYSGGAPMSAQIARKLVGYFQQQPENEYELSDKDEEILGLLSKGLLYKEVALKLSISEGYLKKKIHTIYEKLHVQNKTEALNKVFGKRFNDVS
jgi:DNA-binding NarL/FixJ family response regulator